MTPAHDIGVDIDDTPPPGTWDARKALTSESRLRAVTHTPQSKIEAASAQIRVVEPRRIDVPQPIAGQPYVVVRYGLTCRVVTVADEVTLDLTTWAEMGLSPRVRVYQSRAPFGEMTAQERAAVEGDEVPPDRLELVGEIRDGRIHLVREVLAPRAWLDLGGHLVRAALAEDGSYRAHPDDAFGAVIGMSDALHGAAWTDRGLEARIRAVREV